ncbi:MAG TPA: hypothetical protein VIJ39_10405 [Solirubrobacteraceae bacterium]
MKKFQILGLTLFAVFALSAVVASSAFAVSEFLVGGVAAKAGETGESTGMLALTDLTSLGEATVTCTGILDGVFDSANDFLVTEVLNLAKELIGPALGTGSLALECEGSGLCEKAGAKVWPVHLPWLAEVVLDAGTTFLLHLTEAGSGFPGYEVVCKTLLGETTDECVGLVSALLENTATELLALFSLVEQEKEKEEATCTFTKEATGHLQGEGLLKAKAATAAS